MGRMPKIWFKIKTFLRKEGYGVSSRIKISIWLNTFGNILAVYLQPSC